jgi:hypothetical protein
MSKKPVGVIVYDDFENPQNAHEPTVVVKPNRSNKVTVPVRKK